GPGRMGSCQRNGEICDPVGAGQQSGQNGGVRRVRNRTGRERLREPDAVGCQGVQSRRLNVFVAITADMVGTEGVNGDKKNVGMKLGGRRTGKRQHRDQKRTTQSHQFQTSTPPVRLPASHSRPAFRYNFQSSMSTILRSVLLLAVFIPPGFSTAIAQSGPRPNVVLITIDTLRPDRLGCYGYKQARTPNLDALAAGGVRFDRAYTSVPVTLPSHTVILTGTFPTYSGMHDFAGNKLNAAQPTLASVLK